ncbi:MAG: DoxX family protein [Saprospiraceae bacterium]|nr:DoxX family protein [Saprospiraceae bacterium]MBK8449018.1 DoxX family protein [Saprospiraceae bacterium]MBK8484928.1 DoxX family protein [Saprospiraceae bacterium]MBK9223259.1 DoxX family protein [Saprospiraceae bacterium]MBK9720789.1 DoxX family protein [Saprospiraceae bacterium]
MKDIFDLVARTMLAAISLYEAFTSVQFMTRTKETMIEYGISWNPDLLIYLTAFALALGGIFLLIGYRPGFAVTLLLMYWVPVTFIVYSFWNDPEHIRNIQAIHFMKNIAFIGGMIHVLVYGTGKYSVRRFFGITKLPKEKW